ncbi:MAG: transglutaminaseTgpA domain-containing protein [Cyanobacteria bacterium P01_C01_bin.147]
MSQTPTTLRRPGLRRWFRQRNRTSATLDVENSRLLRILVQMLVSVGIASVSVAAAGVTQASYGNLLAIPLSALGGYWSWKARHQNNIAVKFCIAFGMLMALGIFLAGLVGSENDTRIQLAELLIHLQVLHSFDMPRRKDLGYSMVIGLILLGVAATVSQSLTFAPLLISFLAITLPVLMLDYQSRLKLLTLPTGVNLQSPLTLQRLVWLLLLTLALGLAIFAALPRLPGYQIRNFPISSTVDFQGEFTGDEIVNPGYSAGTGISPDLAEAAGADGDSTQILGGSSAQGPGEFDDTSYYGFSQRMNQNLRGTLEPQVLMRVRSQAPGFWRVLSFDRYTGQGWEISRDDEVEVLERSSVSFQTKLPSTAYSLLQYNTQGRQRQVVQTYTIVNGLPNLIPALYQADELYFPTREVAIDAEGSLRSPLPLAEGITYSVVSDVPYRDRTALRQAQQVYDSDIKQVYLQVPPAIRDRVREQTEALLAQSPQPLTAPYEKALYLAQSLKQNYTMQTELPFFTENEDLVEAFLFTYEGGYPDHFSTVLTVMLRSIGIPARLVTGFGSGRFNPFTGYYVVSNTDAYAITEVFFPGFGWFGFDPIPGHEVLPPSIKDRQTFSVLRQFWHWVAGWLPSPVTGWLSSLLAWLVARFSQLVRFFSEGLAGFLAALLTLTGVSFLGWLSWQGWQRWRQHARLRKLPAVERLYQQMLVWLAAQGHPKRPTQTPLEYAQALTRQSQFTQGDQVLAIVQTYIGWRYGNAPADPENLQQQLKGLKKSRGRRQSDATK